MALLGSSVDPRLFMQDYSGFTRAAEIQAQGMQNLGAAIGQGIKDFGEARQERKKLDAGIKANRKSIESALKLGESLGIDVSSLNPILEQMDDPNITPMEAAAFGQAGAQRITDTLNLGIGLQDRAAKLEQSRAKNLHDKGMLEASQTRAAASLFGVKQRMFEASQGPAPKFELRKPQIASPTGEVFEGPELPYDESRGMYFDPKVKKYIADPNLIGTGKEYAPDSAMPTPTSQVMPSDGSFEFTYDTRDKLPASSPTNRQISLDFNAAPNKNAKGIEIIIPNNATEEERQLAQEYVAKTQQYFAERGVNVPARGVRTAKENGRGTPNRFHTEPFFVGDASSRAVMEKDPDGYAQVLASTLGRIPGAMFIPPHKSNDPGASDGKFNERDFAKGSIIPALERLSKQKSAQASPAGIDNAISMTGDMTQQAMGTPEQQAEVALMIEEGQGMAMAQNMPQGAIPTEPSMTTQQPQLPQQAAPQWTPPPGFTPFRPQGNKPTTTMSAEQVKNLTAQGFKVDAVPTNDGNFMVSGVTAGGQTPRYTKTPQEDLESQRLTALDREQADLRSAGLSASQDIAQLKGITNLLDASVKTGFGRETIMRAKRVIGADVANEEQFQSLVGNEAMKNIALTKGAISDREMDYFKNVLSPNMGKTTEGNKKILEFRIRFSERASKIAKTITKMQSQGKSPFDVQEQVDNIIASEPLFSPSDANITPQNQAESDANFLEGFRMGE